MYCLRCGTKVDDKVEYCPHCGSNIKEELSSKVMNNINKKYKIIKINKFLLPKENSKRSLVIIEKKDNRII